MVMLAAVAFMCIGTATETFSAGTDDTAPPGPSQSSGDSAEEPLSAPKPTVPDQGRDPVEDDVPEVAALVASTGRTAEEITAVLDAQGAISAVITPLRQSEWYVDFMFTPEGTSGVLLTEPGGADKARAAVRSLSVDVVEAALDRADRDLAVSVAAAVAERQLVDAYVAASYSSFQNEATV